MEPRKEITYAEPDIATLRASLDNLTKITASQRTETLKTILKLAADTNDPKILIGGILFYLEEIKREYALLSPTRSRLFNELTHNVLGSTPENSITDRNILIYIRHFYEHRKTKLLSRESKEPYTLDSEFGPVIDNILKRFPDLKNALTKKPDLDYLKTRLEFLPDTYETACASRMWNPTAAHKKCILFLKFLSSSEAEKILLKLSKAKTVEEDIFKQYNYTVYFGALLYTMLQIEKEYEGTLQRPENSDAYRLCKSSLNIEHTNNVPDILKLNFFADLRRFMRAVLEDENSIKLLNSYKVYPAKILGGFTVYSPTFFTDAKSFIETRADTIETLMKSESFIWQCTKSAINYVILTGAGIACFEVASLSYSIGIGQGFLSGLGGKLGELLIRGPWGAYIGTVIGAKYEKEAVVGTIASSLMLTIKYLREWTFGEPKSSLDDCEQSDRLRSELKEEIGLTKALCEEEARRLSAEIEFYKAITFLPSSKISPHIRKRVQVAIVEPAEAKQEAKAEYEPLRLH